MRPDAFLKVDRASHHIDRARKLGQHGISRGVEDAAAPSRDEIVEDSAVNGEAAERLLLVLRQEVAVARNVGGQNG